MDTRIVFMGSPDFALPTLQALAANFQVVGVVTQPDRPAGRGRDLKAPPVKELALNLGIPIIQPENLKETQSWEHLKGWNPDVIVVAAFGQILSAKVLNLPTYGCINVHASLLPRWRGAAPINAAILHGDQKTGITIMKMDEGLDTGPIINKAAISIAPDETAGSLFPKLAKLGGDLLIETLPAYLSGELVPQPQDDSHATYIKMLERSDGELDFGDNAEALARKVRAYNPWPGTYLMRSDQRLKIQMAHASSATSPGVGVFTTKEGFPAVGTAQGLIILDEVQPPGKKTMSGDAFLLGSRDWVNP